MRHNVIQHAFFFALLIITTLMFLDLVRDFLQPVFWAAVLAILFRPVHKRWYHAVNGRPALAAVLTVLTVFFAVLLPLILVTLAVSREVINLYDQIATGAIDIQVPIDAIGRLLPMANDFLAQFGIDIQEINENLSAFAATASRYLASQALELGQDALRFAALFFLMLYLLFFFVRDGGRIINALIQTLPLGDERERRLFSKFAEVSRATIKGTIVVGVVQGALGGLIFWILGIDAPIFWGVVMSVFSIFPAVGAAIIWVPAAIILFVTGEIVKGIILIAFGTLVISLVDNVLRPILVGRDTRMPDYLILLSTLGGLAAFGISGFVIGPIIAALFLVVWDIFQQDYSEEEDVEDVKEAALHPQAVPDEPPEKDEVVHKDV